ncbi:hypothetical protein D9M69_302780 [compost metagenome]
MQSPHAIGAIAGTEYLPGQQRRHQHDRFQAKQRRQYDRQIHQPRAPPTALRAPTIGQPECQNAKKPEAELAQNLSTELVESGSGQDDQARQITGARHPAPGEVDSQSAGPGHKQEAPEIGAGLHGDARQPVTSRQQQGKPRPVEGSIGLSKTLFQEDVSDIDI